MQAALKLSARLNKVQTQVSRLHKIYGLRSSDVGRKIELVVLLGWESCSAWRSGGLRGAIEGATGSDEGLLGMGRRSPVRRSDRGARCRTSLRIAAHRWRATLLVQATAADIPPTTAGLCERNYSPSSGRGRAARPQATISQSTSSRGTSLSTCTSSLAARKLLDPECELT